MEKKHEKKREIELLAPAKDYETGRIAVLAGADAVYIGAPRFGARAAAGNSWEDIAKLCEFAHLYGVKVYLAINTIIFDAELDEVKQSIWKAHEIGIDAIIVQDMGILEMDLPPIQVFASTQTDNRTIEQVKFLEKTGFSRAILARELSLGEIRHIKEQTDIDLECFVHGALCVSYSGRCYLSQATSGRSANRGMCMQACRLPYSLVDAKGREIIKEKYLLSLKDLNLSGHLEELIDAGITSFKIEGRLKDKAYVANIVSYYRGLLDGILASREDIARTSIGNTITSIRPDPQKSFNRGFCEYFISGKKDSWISPDTQKSLGEKMGEVAKVYGHSFTLRKGRKISNGDGICFLGKEGKLYGGFVNRVDEKGKIYPHKKLPLFPGAVIYRNENPSFEKEIVSGLSRRLDTRILLQEKKEKIVLSAMNEDGVSISLELDNDFSLADKPEKAEDNFISQMEKSGDSLFAVSEVKADWKKPLFIPISTLNDWRRRILEDLEKKRVSDYKAVARDNDFNIQKGDFPEKLDYQYNVANHLAKDFYHKRGVGEIEEAIEVSHEYSGKKLMTTKHCLKYHLGICPRNMKNKNLDITEPLYLKTKNNKLRLRFDCAACNMEIYEED